MSLYDGWVQRMMDECDGMIAAEYAWMSATV